MVTTGCQEDFESLDFFGKGINDFGLRELFQFCKILSITYYHHSIIFRISEKNQLFEA